jgi:phosphatidylserine decarboxylase
MADFFARWCRFLPAVEGAHDDGLRYIKELAKLYDKNEHGVAFVQRGTGREITQRIVSERRTYMDSPASAANVADWLSDPRIDREDYRVSRCSS